MHCLNGEKTKEHLDKLPKKFHKIRHMNCCSIKSFTKLHWFPFAARCDWSLKLMPSSANETQNHDLIARVITHFK